MQSPDRWSECPYGFTTRSFTFDGKKWAVSGVIGFPRFGSEAERQMAKKFPDSRVSRDTIESTVSVSRELERVKSDVVAEGAKILPQAFHELRKLNGAVIQHAERAMTDQGETRNLLSIKSAAELMRNNFDILEALSNIEGMKSLPVDSTVNLFDLAFKMKRVYQERALARKMGIQVNGVRAIIQGSQKSFPLVPAVLLENAIKYGTIGETIHIDITAEGGRAVLVVENHSNRPIDPVRCFERGVRFSNDVEGGGFGLFLAREVVIAHRGTIRCAPSTGRVKMIVEIPLVTII
ncbi:HAMP domain-containing sensor histidine kinase [Caenimonas sp. SL110]|uniref:sensor histidine kinase n=1 Tax=Caenimonas sp. SL110 TaxID=1450524 RepID=UPI001379145C|nr:HAMP domain-containing sensor histidine kinase [Caenimonas sp. SL110]